MCERHEYVSWTARSREVEETQVRSTSKGKDSEKVAEARIQNTGSSCALKERRGTLTIAIGGKRALVDTDIC